jgi:hypothetical protein
LAISSIILALTQSHPPGSDTQQDVAVLQPASDITEVSPTTNEIHQPKPNAGEAPQISEESTHITPTTYTDSLSPPIMMPTVHGGVILMVLLPSVESALVQPDRVEHALRSPSSSHTTARSRVTLRITPVQDSGLTASRTQTRSIPMELTQHNNPSKPPSPDIVHAPPPGDHEQD